jgi:hypothetical protein
MIQTRIRSITLTSIATMALALTAFGLATAPAATGAGLRNCVDVTGPQTGLVGCNEDVWADGVQVHMTFANQSFRGAAPKDLDPFYVLAPQTGTAQGHAPTFMHDHVVRAVPGQNHGGYSVQLQGFFVVCTGQGIVSGACDPLWTSPAGPALPFAGHVNGQPLTSTEAVEAAAAAGDVVLINLGPGAVIVGTVTRGN